MPKINGKTIKNQGHKIGPYPVVRNVDGAKHVYYIFAEPVWSFDKFNELYPAPTPPIGGWSKDGKKGDYRDPQYLQDVEEYKRAREGWTLLTSLAPSNIELDGVSLDDPKTWSSIKPKLIELFSFYEYNQIIDMIDEACGINEEKIAENRESFLSEPQAPSTALIKA